MRLEAKLAVAVLVILSAFAMNACRSHPTAMTIERTEAAQTSIPSKACWGQATKVFAKLREMGIHASEQNEPRYGLRNLARELFEQGVIEDDSMEALGRFVSAELGLSIEACMD